MSTHLISVDRGHDEGVGAEVGPDSLHELDRLAERLAPVEVREGEGPHDLREEREERGQDVGDRQVEDEEEHPRDLGPPQQDGEDDGEVAQDGHEDDDAEHADLDVVDGEGLAHGPTGRPEARGLDGRRGLGSHVEELLGEQTRGAGIVVRAERERRGFVALAEQKFR